MRPMLLKRGRGGSSVQNAIMQRAAENRVPGASPSATPGVAKCHSARTEREQQMAASARTPDASAGTISSLGGALADRDSGAPPARTFRSEKGKGARGRPALAVVRHACMAAMCAPSGSTAASARQPTPTHTPLHSSAQVRGTADPPAAGARCRRRAGSPEARDAGAGAGACFPRCTLVLRSCARSRGGAAGYARGMRLWPSCSSWARHGAGAGDRRWGGARVVGRGFVIHRWGREVRYVRVEVRSVPVAAGASLNA